MRRGVEIGIEKARKFGSVNKKVMARFCVAPQQHASGQDLKPVAVVSYMDGGLMHVQSHYSRVL